jgi:hypothetical protein
MIFGISAFIAYMILTVLHTVEGQHLENPLIQLRTGRWEVQAILQVGICTVLQYGSSTSPMTYYTLYFPQVLVQQ